MSLDKLNLTPKQNTFRKFSDFLNKRTLINSETSTFELSALCNELDFLSISIWKLIKYRNMNPSHLGVFQGAKYWTQKYMSYTQNEEN